MILTTPTRNMATIRKRQNTKAPMDRKATESERQSHTETHPKLKFSFPGMCA
jgi:hypothetical protein